MKSINIEAINHNGELVILTNSHKLQVRRWATNEVVYECKKHSKMVKPIFLPDKDEFLFTAGDGSIEIHNYINQEVLYKGRIAENYGNRLIYNQVNQEVLMSIIFKKKVILFDLEKHTTRVIMQDFDFVILKITQDPRNRNGYFLLTRYVEEDPNITVMYLKIEEEVSLDVIYSCDSYWTSVEYCSEANSFYYTKEETDEDSSLVFILDLKTYSVKSIHLNKKWNLGLSKKIIGLIGIDKVLMNSIGEDYSTGIFDLKLKQYTELTELIGLRNYVSLDGSTIAINYGVHKNKFFKKIDEHYEEVVIKNGQFN